MSNPFKIKKLEEFTIKDCEDYLASYPYGEHSIDVRKRLKGLRSGKITLKYNPFTTKQLSDFNINDCLSYLHNFPNGDHCVVVQKKLDELRNGIAKISTNLSEGKVKKVKSKNSTEKNIKEETYSTNTTVQNTASSKVESKSSDTVDTILSWIGLIVVVLIVGTIIIFVLDAILPEGTAEFISKYKYLIYPVGLALARWIDEKK